MPSIVSGNNSLRRKNQLEKIEFALENFRGKNDLYQSAITLLSGLGYESEKRLKLNRPTYDSFLDAFSIKESQFSAAKALVDEWARIDFLFQIGDTEVSGIQSLFEAGKLNKTEYQSFLFVAIELKHTSYKRADFVNITRELNRPFFMPVIVLFHHDDKLTLSIIDRRLHKRDTSKDVLEKVTIIKDINLANPQRAHKEILADLSLNDLQSHHPFNTFSGLHDAWKKTLNISELNKKFYRELANWYEWAVQEVKFPDDVLKDNTTRNPISVIRLITRIIFIWFLKEKGLVPDELFQKHHLDKVLAYKDKTGSTYYKAILQNLFFATLNTPMNRDEKDSKKHSRTFINRQHGIQSYFRYEKLIKDQEKFQEWMNKVPFLNGGLFECLDKRTKDFKNDLFIDAFTQQSGNEQILRVPDELFFSPEQPIDLNGVYGTKGKKYEVRGLIDILSRYKFTIEENTPIEEEVALDPELLGKVFENLLASYNEETKTTARKMTGSFYTPREIVNYMVDESLIAYLKGAVKISEERLRNLFAYTTYLPSLEPGERENLVAAIDGCRIIDPACGSGAFPMGILQKLVFLLARLDPDNSIWIELQKKRAIRETKKAYDLGDKTIREQRLMEISETFEYNNDDYGRKLYLIENCIYGVDKQPIAVQIAKLRFFISLVADQRVDEVRHNLGVRPLPNLETKFVAADTLVPIEQPKQLSLVNLILEDKISGVEDELHNIREQHFRARTPATKERYRKRDEELREKLAILLKEAGFSKDETEKLAHWNPYDQNAAAGFFDPKWMFEIDNGFDIVIGNPPYRIITRNNTDPDTLKYYLSEYKSILNSSSKNLFALFIERGIKIVSKNGVLCMIVPEGLFQTRSYSTVVSQLEKAGNVHSVTTFSSYVFDNAVTGSLIFIFQKCKDPNSKKLYQFDENLILRELKTAKVNIGERLLNDGLKKLSDVSLVFKGIVVKDRGEVISETKKGMSDRFLLGKNISKWSINSSYYTNYSDLIVVGGTKSKIKHDTIPRVLVRRTGDYLCCAYLETKAITESTLYSVCPLGEDYTAKYLLAILNTNVSNYLVSSAMLTNKQAFPQILMTDLEELPIPKPKSTEQLEHLVDIILTINKERSAIKTEIPISFFESILNGCVYELYFEYEMKSAGVSILDLVTNDLRKLDKAPMDELIIKLFKQWNDPKNEVRNRLLLMPTRCQDTIGLIESNL